MFAAMYGCPPPRHTALGPEQPWPPLIGPGRIDPIDAEECAKKIVDSLQETALLGRKEFQMAIESLRAQLREIEAKVDAPTKDLERQLEEEKRARYIAECESVSCLKEVRRLKRKVNRLLKKLRPKKVVGLDGTEPRVPVPEGWTYLGRALSKDLEFDVAAIDGHISLRTQRDHEAGYAHGTELGWTDAAVRRRWSSAPDKAAVALYDRWKAAQK